MRLHISDYINIAIFAVITCSSTLAAQTGRQSVTIDVDFAEQVLAEVCSNADIDDATIRQSKAVQDMLSHFVKFRDDFTMENYIEARHAAAKRQTHDRDIFRFGDVIENWKI